MVAFDVDLSTGDELAALTRELKALNLNVAREMMRTEVPVVERQLDNTLKRYTPPKPDYPIQWTSEKQRRYVFWKLRREQNLPYKRRGIQRLWVIEVTQRDGVFTVMARNPAAAAEFVYRRQQRFLRKWARADDEVINATLQLDAALVRIIDRMIARKL